MLPAILGHELMPHGLKVGPHYSNVSGDLDDVSAGELSFSSMVYHSCEVADTW